jgi:MFS family permease
LKKNIKLLYGFSFFDQFMIVIPLLVPYLGTKEIGMGQFMELQAIFALVIVCGEVPAGLLSDLWGRRKTLLLGSALKAASFSLLPLWSGYEGFLVYHLTMGVALSLISGGDVALLYDSHLASGGEKSRGVVVLGNGKLWAQSGVAASAVLCGAIAALSYEHLLWVNAAHSWMPVLLVLRLAEPPASPGGARKWTEPLKEIQSAVLARDAATRLVFLNMVAFGVLGLVMVWTNQKYWEAGGVPLVYFGVLYAGYNLTIGFAGRAAAALAARYGRRNFLAAAGALPVAALFGMAAFPGWVGIALGILVPIGRGMGDVLFLDALNRKIPSSARATVISLVNMCFRAVFALLGPLAGYGIDSWGLSLVLTAVALASLTVFALLLLPLVLAENRP